MEAMEAMEAMVKLALAAILIVFKKYFWYKNKTLKANLCEKQIDNKVDNKNSKNEAIQKLSFSSDSFKDSLNLPLQSCKSQ
jgi:hypothetical protein